MKFIIRYFRKPHPIVGSFVSAGVPFLPLLGMSLYDISTMPSGNVDANRYADDGRADAMVVLYAPILYIIAIPLVYGAGKLLSSFGLMTIVKFTVGMGVVALILATCLGLFISAITHLGLIDTTKIVALCSVISLFTALPSGLCWWIFAIRPKMSERN